MTPIWPPTGIALAGLLLFGRRVWPAIALAAFLVNAPIGPSLMTAAGVAVGNTAAPLLCATCSEGRLRPELDRIRDAMAIVLSARSHGGERDLRDGDASSLRIGPRAASGRPGRCGGPETPWAS